MPTAHAYAQSPTTLASTTRARAHAPSRGELRDGIARLMPELYGRALRMTRNAALAEDVVQDTIERALRFEGQYEVGTNLRAWVQKILFSVFVTRCRRLRRERSALDSLSTDPCAWTALDAAPAMVELSPPTARAVAALPVVFREVVSLVDLADLSYKDAAAILGVPVGTVMSRLHRGRRLLAAALAGEREPRPRPITTADEGPELPEAA